DGPEGLALGGDHPGNAFSEFQRHLKLLSDSGIALAVCSKNDDQHAIDAMSTLPDMHLRPDDLVSRRINWKPKYQNVTEICEELSLGLASVLFVDDNPAERQQMRQFLPEVKVLDLPDDPALYVRALFDSPWLTNLETTREDRLRVENYRARRKTLELQASAANLDEFYMSLGSRVYLSRMTSANRARTVQLVNKTNQFNTTTHRYDAQALERIDAGDGQVAVIGYEDRFSRLENIGVLIARWSGMPRGVVEIDTYLLSCRILGRGIEQTILKQFAARMTASGFRLVRGMIIETERNSPVRDIYASSGFSLSPATGYWELSLPDPALAIPEWVEVIDEFEEQN
ncbi:MAG: HAD-IIIC family phosphatase, partial [Rhodospirillales bacterium]